MPAPASLLPGPREMNATLNRHEVRAILDYLDRALANTRAADTAGLEGNGTWCINMARNRLMDVAPADVSVETAGAT
jgi:hypothetical protein